MKNNLESFVKEHKAEFNTFEPSAAIWQNIDTSSITSTSTTISKVTWLKSFIFGASVLSGVFYVALKPENTPPSNKNQVVNTTVLPTKKETERIEKKNDSLPHNVSNNSRETNNTLTVNRNHSLFATAKSDKNGETVITIESVRKTEIPPTSMQEGNALSTPPLLSKLPNPPQLPALPESPISSKKATHPFSKGHDSKTLIMTDTVFSGIKSIEVNSSFSDISIRTNDGDKTALNFSIPENDDQKKSQRKKVNAKNNEQQQQIFFEIKDSNLIVTINCKEKIIRRSDKDLQSYYLDFTLPKNTDVTINNRSGDVFMNGIEGSHCTIFSTMGNISTENSSTKLDLKSNIGEISVETNNGPVSINSTLGDVSLKNINGDLNIENSSGDISVQNIIGNSQVKTSLGDQNFSHITGEINSKSSSGYVEIIQMKGNLNISSSLGDIFLSDYNGNPVLSSSSGNITGEKIEILDNIQLTTTLGDVKMELINRLDELNFDLTTTLGDLIIEKEGIKIQEEKKLQLNKGRILIKADTNSGNQVFN